MAVHQFSHKQIVEIAYRWVLKKCSCGIAFKELNTATNGEYPDVIGFGGWAHSVLVEVKVTRSDFLSDKNKPFRKSPEKGMGTLRYYCCPAGLITVKDLPVGWGLVYVNEKGKPTLVHQPLMPNVKYPDHMVRYENEKNIIAEHGIVIFCTAQIIHQRLCKAYIR